MVTAHSGGKWESLKSTKNPGMFWEDWQSEDYGFIDIITQHIKIK